ncbi:MAG: hypothetical protein U1F10_05195 [Burkholderiales bacterium]
MKLKLLKSAVAMGVAATVIASAPAAASDNRTITVNANITAVCKFFTASPVINVTNTGTGANIDPSAAGPATGNVGVTYRCTNGTTPNFTVPTSTTLSGSGATPPTMSATVTSSNTGNGTGLGSGKDQTLTVTASIPQTTYENAVVGNYTGSIVVSVSP